MLNRTIESVTSLTAFWTTSGSKAESESILLCIALVLAQLYAIRKKLGSMSPPGLSTFDGEALGIELVEAPNLVRNVNSHSEKIIL